MKSKLMKHQKASSRRSELQATVSSKGQFTFPADIRRRYAIRKGDKFAVEVGDDQFVLTRLPSITEQTKGIFKGRGPAMSAEELRVAAEKAIAEDVMRRSGG